MNYTIPKTRQQAIKIFDNIWYLSALISKYHMFIGALTECSDWEFKYYTNVKCNVCESVLYMGSCMNNDGMEICEKVHKKLFSKHWNE